MCFGDRCGSKSYTWKHWDYGLYNLVVIFKGKTVINMFDFRSDFLHKLAVSVISNANPALQTINLSHNLIEDKGMIGMLLLLTF